MNNGGPDRGARLAQGLSRGGERFQFTGDHRRQRVGADKAMIGFDREGEPGRRCDAGLRKAPAQLAEQWRRDAADDPEAPYLLAVARESMNQVEPAIRALLQSIEIDPDYSRSWVMLVRIYERTGRRLEAQHALAMLNVRNPKLGQALSDELQSGGRETR